MCVQWSKEVVRGVLAQVERPVGILTVRLIEAENIPKTDLCSESDPYVVYASTSLPTACCKVSAYGIAAVIDYCLQQLIPLRNECR